MSKIIILVPARMSSTRLPNKILADIDGHAMIIRVCNQAKLSGYNDIIVACCEEEVKQLVNNHGYKAILTDKNLPSGTDRIYQALTNLENNQEIDIIVNLQGDLPNIAPQVISKTINVLQNNPSADIATAVVEIKDKKLADNPNIVKAVVNFSQDQKSSEVHYFSRSNIPYGAKNLYEHIGIYAYRRNALEKFVKLAPTNLEICEKLEQLRAIENSMRIFACNIPYKDKPISVDSYDDLEEARKIICNKLK
jgi:3-deoxy-manno-octulosonate cytidylyltransferase (CMP-KDO synthetase)